MAIEIKGWQQRFQAAFCGTRYHLRQPETAKRLYRHFSFQAAFGS
ncbi:hypothetical protein [Kingella sp. (in: b-proteobacteria)]|nr:hypothetical protein [Kingella sp. (in: b-proteobacteria)]MDO4658260.1 hypothetical protein [Kingella sp. (in: b-proteobacteria)]